MAISGELCGATADLRAALPQNPEWSMLNAAGAASGRPFEEPVDYADLLQIADGLICGKVVMFSADSVGRSQILAEGQEGVPVQLGRDTWFCVSKVNEDPLLLNRVDGSVWGFPDMGILWWQSARFERIADDLDRFLLDQVFGGGYLTLTGSRPTASGGGCCSTWDGCPSVDDVVPEGRMASRTS